MASVRTPRKKTFTGCWTCRSRRVKCDEQLPFCQRCKLFGVECEGYGVRLTWLFSDGEGQFQHDANTPTVDTQFVRTRRSMRVFENSEAWITPQYSEPELDAMLERIDKCPTHSSGRERGLFSVFPMQRVSSPSQSNLIICESSSVQDPEEDIDDPENIDVSVTRETTNTIDSPTARNVPSQQPVHLKHNPTPLSGEPGWRKLTIEDTDGASSDGAQQNGPCQSHTPSLVQTALSLTPKPARHLDSLPTPSHEKRLIHHWVTFTSGKLVLVDEPHNPCRSMMLPMALQGIMMSPDESTADVAVFHAICAGAAYNLYELGGRANEQDRALAWKHDEQAIHHLRHNLAQPDQHHTKSLAMAIMACITVEAISGTTGRWRTHLDGGIAYLTELRKTAIGLQISLAFQVHLIPMAILCGYPVPVELKSFLNDDAEKLEFSFPYYGISQSLLRNLDRINAFAAASDRNVLQSDLDRFELQLYLDFPPNPDDPNPKTHTAIVHYMTQAFYYALLVHYQRAIRHSPLEEVQALVEKGIAQLELIEQATQDTAGSVMMWAPLVLGAACCGPALQRRISAWFQKKRRLGMRNVAVIEDMIKDLWDKRARGDVDVDWQHLIAQEQFNVFRL
jgi:hypothetical protein